MTTRTTTTPDNRNPGEHAAPHPAKALFNELVDAVEGRDYQLATRLRRQLYAAGWSVIPRATWQGGGRP